MDIHFAGGKDSTGGKHRCQRIEFSQAVVPGGAGVIDTSAYSRNQPVGLICSLFKTLLAASLVGERLRFRRPLTHFRKCCLQPLYFAGCSRKGQLGLGWLRRARIAPGRLRIRTERELVGEIKRRAHETPRLWREPFVRPRAAAVTGTFGVVRIFNGVVRSRHLGVDFAGERGAPVRATNRGVVAFVGDLYYSGKTIFIDHGAGLVTGYLHLSSALVAPGDTVACGQLIGRVGASGRVTGPHLHWLADYGNLSVDPLDLITVDLNAPLSFSPGPEAKSRAGPQPD